MTVHTRKGVLVRLFPLLALLILLAQASSYAQQPDAGADGRVQPTYSGGTNYPPRPGYVGRYDVYAGFSDINAPFVNNLNQPGFGLQVGVLTKTWFATGFDFSNENGATSLTPSLLPTTLQQELGAGLPPGYVLSVPTHVNIKTFAFGPQLTYRHFHSATLLFHPALSAFRISATPHPTDPVATAVTQLLVPQGTKVDWVGAYGVGGGADLRITRHLSARMQADFAWCHPFNDILANGGWISRFSVGPAFHFGHNIAGPTRH